jgi:hypothetical protein
LIVRFEPAPEHVGASVSNPNTRRHVTVSSPQIGNQACVGIYKAPRINTRLHDSLTTPLPTSDPSGAKYQFDRGFGSNKPGDLSPPSLKNQMVALKV